MWSVILTSTMETQPLQVPQEQQSSTILVPDPLNQTIQPVAPNSYVRTTVSALLLVAIGAIGAYFLINRANTISPVQTTVVTPPLQVSTDVKLVQLEDDTQPIKNITIRDVKNSYISVPELTRTLHFISDSGSFLLKDGSATFAYCDGYQSCDSDKIKNATVTVSTITAQKDPVLMTSNHWGENDGAMILTFDFGNSQKEYYLGMFVINYDETEKQNHIYFSHIKNLGNVVGNIDSIDISHKEEVTLNLSKGAGLLQRTFLIVNQARNFSDLVEVTADRSQKIYEDQKLGYSFTYPQVIGMLSRYQSERALALESTLKTSPIYYARECGIQPTFADNRIPFWSTNASGTVSLSADVTVHKIDVNAPVYLTSSLYGYDPADWDKIKEKVSIQDYVNSVNAGASISGRKVISEKIQGYTVRHIMPFSIGRPCDDQSREQYQWVKGNLLFNLIFTESKSQPSSIQQKTELINSILSSLKVK